MTLGDTVAVLADEKARAFGFAQRRSWVFWAWWYGVTLAASGAGDASLRALAGQDPERGLTIVILGAALSGLGWLLTVRVRYSRKPPKPAVNVARLEQSLRHSPRAVALLLVLAVLIPAAMFFVNPGSISPVSAPSIGFVGACLLSLAVGVAHSGRQARDSLRLYSQWLERRPMTESSSPA